jgi:hypothetical protein
MDTLATGMNEGQAGVACPSHIVKTGSENLTLLALLVGLLA